MGIIIALPIEPFKDAVMAALGGIRVQIALIEENSFTPHRERSIQMVRTQTLYFSELIRKTDESLTIMVQDQFEKAVHNGAKFHEKVSGLATKTSDPDVKQIAEITKKLQPEFVKELGKKETEAVKLISKGLAELNEEVNRILKIIDNMRVR